MDFAFADYNVHRFCSWRATKQILKDISQPMCRIYAQAMMAFADVTTGDGRSISQSARREGREPDIDRKSQYIHLAENQGRPSKATWKFGIPLSETNDE